jgi:hypothetical protein
MSTPTHDQFTLLYEDEGKKVLHEFKAVFTDEVVRELADFVRGCGHHDDNVFGAMARLSSEYFECKEDPVLPFQEVGQDLD